MEQALKQRLIGATILISLVVIFVPMLIGEKSAKTATVSLDIPQAPEDLESKILPLLDVETEVLAEVKINKGTSVVVKKETIPEPPKAKPVVGLKAWIIQVGSFSEHKNAANLAERLKTAGITAFVETSETKGEELFRVRVGPEISRAKADALTIKLKTEHKIANPIVVQYP